MPRFWRRPFSSRRVRPAPCFRPGLETLEDRALLTAYATPYAAGLDPAVVSAMGALTGPGRLYTTEATTTPALNSPADWYQMGQYDQPNNPESQGASWGPQPLLQPTPTPPAGVAANSFLGASYYVQNVLAAAAALVHSAGDAQFTGTAYQHHHDALWNPYANGFSSDPAAPNYWPWSPVTVNNASNADLPVLQPGGKYTLTFPSFANPYQPLYGQGTAGIDCSDTTALAYNAGAGIFLNSAAGGQGLVDLTGGANAHAGRSPPGWYNPAAAGGQPVFINPTTNTPPNAYVTPITPQFFVGPHAAFQPQGDKSYNYITTFNQPGELQPVLDKLQPGDLLYIAASPGASSNVSHVVLWLGQYGTLADGSQSPVPLVISSHDNTPAVLDAAGNLPPPGVQILPFTPDTWFYQNFSHAMRVLPTLPKLAVTASSGQPALGTPVTLTATITVPGPAGAAAPTGTVTFLAGAAVLGATGTFTPGPTPNTFVATLTTAALSADRVVTAKYSGDGAYPADAATLLFAAGTQPTALVTSSVGPFIRSTPGTVARYGDPVAFQVIATDRLYVNGTAAPASGALTLALGGAPAWLSLDGSNRLVGQPPAVAAGQTYAFTITARAGVGPDAVQHFVLTTAGQAAPAFTSGDSAGFTEGTAGSFTLTASGFPRPNFSVTSGSLPQGLSLADLGGGRAVIYGTPAAGASGGSPYTVTLTAGDGNVFPKVTQTLTLVVAPPPPAVQLLAVGTDAGGAAGVKVYNAATAAPVMTLTPFAANFTGGVRVAVGRVQGAGADDVVCAAGPGGGPDVAVYSGASGARLFSFFPFAQNFTGGVTVAVGDVNADGYADVVCGAGAGGGPHVVVVSGKDQSVLRSFFAFDPKFTGGVTVAAGDVDGDGYADVVVGAGPGGGPHVRVFSGKTGAELASFFAFDPKFTGGVHVAAGTVHGRGQIVTGAGAGGGPDVKVFEVGAGGAAVPVWGLFPYAANFQGGVRVGVAGTDAAGVATYLTVPGPGGGPDLKRYNGVTGHVIDQVLAEPPTYLGGLFVAADPG